MALSLANVYVGQQNAEGGCGDRTVSLIVSQSLLWFLIMLCNICIVTLLVISLELCLHTSNLTAGAAIWHSMETEHNTRAIQIQE